MTAGHLVGGRYRLIQPIGRGGMATVWHAHDDMLGRDVAVKQLTVPPHASDDERQMLAERVLREARNAARLSAHPHIVAVHDVVLDGGVPWTIMQLVTGHSLQQELDTHGPLPVERAADVAAALLKALGAAHAAGIVHRDVKPANVLLAHDGAILLTDFGIAVRQDDSGLTTVGLIVGSPGYVAPERLRGGSGDAAGDLFSLGVLLYRAVEGVPPFPEGNVLAVAEAPTPVPQRAGRLAPLIVALLEKEPGRRPGVAEALAMLDGVPAFVPRDDDTVVDWSFTPPAPEAPRIPTPVHAPTAVVGSRGRRRAGGPPVSVLAMAAVGVVLLIVIVAAAAVLHSSGSSHNAAFASSAPPTSASPTSAPPTSASPSPSADASATGPSLLPPTPATGRVIGYQGLCLDDSSGATTDGNPVMVNTCNGGANQLWQFGADGTVRTMGKCLDVGGGATTDGAKLDLYTCNGTPAQVWRPNTAGALVNPQAGKCLDDTGSGGSGTRVQIWSCSGASNQKWQTVAMTPLPQTARLTGYQGLCLDNANASTADMNPVIVFACNGGANQQWTVGADGTVKTMGKCLDVGGGAKTNGAKVDLDTCNGTGAQLWLAQSNGELINPQSGRCLDDTNNGGPATQVQIWDCADTANQQWRLS